MGLIWLQDAFCDDINAAGNGLSWESGMTATANLASGECGLEDDSLAGDWRLPTKEEWETFLCMEYRDPAVCNTEESGQWSEDDPFSNVQSYAYWSSTEYGSGNVWFVYIVNGSMYLSEKSSAIYVWPVRDVTP
jgi:hypothetical protein